MADFNIKRFDRLPAIRAQFLTAEDEQPVDLSNALSVDFIMTPAVGSTPVINAPAVIEAPFSAGTVRYDWSATDTTTIGEFIAEWEVTWVGGKKQTFPTGTYHTIAILADLDGA